MIPERVLLSLGGKKKRVFTDYDEYIAVKDPSRVSEVPWPGGDAKISSQVEKEGWRIMVAPAGGVEANGNFARVLVRSHSSDWNRLTLWRGEFSLKFNASLSRDECDRRIDAAGFQVIERFSFAENLVRVLPKGKSELDLFALQKTLNRLGGCESAEALVIPITLPGEGLRDSPST